MFYKHHSSYFCIVPVVRGKHQGFVLYWQKKQCIENITNCRGKWLCFYQLAVPKVLVFWQGFAGQKFKVSAISWGWGAWLQMLVHN